jgi:hypothetical protein
MHIWYKHDLTHITHGCTFHRSCASTLHEKKENRPKIESGHILVAITDSKKEKRKACVGSSLGARALYKNCDVWVQKFVVIENFENF